MTLKSGIRHASAATLLAALTLAGPAAVAQSDSYDDWHSRMHEWMDRSWDGSDRGMGYGDRDRWMRDGDRDRMMGDRDGWMRGDRDRMMGDLEGYGPGVGMTRVPPVDLDGNGVVTATEAAARAETRFTEFDTDEDDAISRDEFMQAAPRGAGRGPSPRMMQNREARFSILDADEDGTVTRAEFLADSEAAFESADSDGDGSVSVWEFRAQRRN